MPQNLDYSLYFNIAFFSTLGLGMLFGFLKGMKKSMWSFFVTIIFFTAFFFTIDIVVNILWTVNLPFLGGLLANVSPALSGVTQLQQALPILLQEYLPVQLQTTLTNVHFMELVTSLAIFIVKIVYTILYFTVIQVIYRLLLWIIRMIIFPSNKKTDKYKSKNRGIGAVFGLLSGAASLYVTLIIFGGLISISQSLVSVMPAPDPDTLSMVEFREGFINPDTEILPLAASTNPLDDPQLIDSMNMINDMIDGYNTNVFVQAQDQITMTSEYTGDEMPLNLYLFDSVLSMDYQDEQIAIREELGIYANVASNIINSDFMSTNNYSDITGDEIRGTFTDLASSNLFTTILPIAVEVGADYFDTNVTIPTDELYAIDWETEIMQLGEIAATAFDLVDAAGVFNNTMDLNTITLNGDDVEQLFDQLGDSDLVTLAAYVAIAPVLEMAGSDISGFITVPDDLDWGTEFKAIGALAGEILNTGLTVGDITEGDPMALLSSLSEIDFTVLLDSKIITNALINILSGNTSVDVSFLNVPSDIVWLDELGGDGSILVNGELRNILVAINGLTSSLDNFDLTNLSLQSVADLDTDAINALFESRILVATITDYVKDLDLGDQITLIMPDSVFDEDGYLLKTELENVVNAVSMVVNELACPVGDTQCLDIGFDVGGMLGLSEDNIDLLLSSDILAATVGNLVLEMGGDILTVPGSAMTTIYVNEIAQDVVSKLEIKKAFLAISILGITDINNVTFDILILNNLATDNDETVLDLDKANILFDSKVLNATLSKYLLDFADGVDALVVVPYQDQDGNVIRVQDPVDGTEYISETELINILKAVLALDIQDFNNIESLDLSLIIDNSAVLLDSAILHATISKQLLDLTDVITVPTNDILGNPIKITTGPVGEQTVFIKKTELEAAFDALSVLGITDINNVAMDISILTNLATDADPTVLDQTKADTLFGSTIINATLSKYLIDFTEGANSLIVVPYEDQDGTVIRTTDATDGTEIISQVELTNILKAVLALDIQDFNNIESLDLDIIISNVSVLLDSSIMHATISKQLLDLTDVVTVPTNDILGNPIKITTGPVGKETVFIKKTELEAAFDALSVLGITDINNVAMDISILTNLATDADPTVLDQTKADTLFGSTIINATLSKYLIDFTEGANSLIVVPYEDQDGTVIRTTDATDGTEIISEVELTNILKAVLALDIQDFNAVDTLDLNVIIDNITVLLDSSIMHATVSKQLLDLGSNVVLIPYVEEDNLTPVRITTGGVGEETEFIAKDELEAVFDALKLLGITDVNSFSGSIDFGAILSDPGNVDVLLTSSIIQATISDQVINLTDTGGASLMKVPYLAEDGVSLIRKTVGNVGFETEYITKTEIKAVFDALDVLGISDINNFGGSVDLAVIAQGTNASTVFASSIIQATVSDQVISLGDDNVILVPYMAEDDVSNIRITVGSGTTETKYINKTELEALIKSLDVLGLTDVENFSGSVDLNLLTDNETINTVLTSSIIQATISDQIISLGDSNTLVVPYMAEDNLTNIRVTTGPVGEETEYITGTEIKAIIDALDVLGIADVESFSGTVDLALLTDNATKTVVLASSVIQATISKQLLDINDGSTFIIPYFEEDTTTKVVIDAGTPGYITTYISKSELSNLLSALDVLGLTDVTGFDSNSVDFATFATGTNASVMLDSAIIQAIVSKQLLDLDATGTVEVPYFEDDGSTLLRIIVGPVGHQTELVKKSELEATIYALDMLGVTDPSAYSGSVNLSLFYDQASRDTLLASSIMQATISKQVLDLGGTVITVPLLADDGSTEVRKLVGVVGKQTDYILKPEIHALFEALELLGITDITTFDGTVSLNKFLPSVDVAYNANQTTLLNSSIMQATISKQITDLGPALLIVPTTDVLGNAIQATISGTLYLYKTEIKSLINAMDILGVTDITSFDGNVGLTALFASVNPTTYDGNQDTMLASASMHATITSQITALDGGAIVLPSTDVSGAAIELTVSSNDFITKAEIKSLINAMDVMGFSGNLGGFGGSIDLSTLYNDTNQTILLSSAIMHATITDQIMGLDGGSLVVPTTDILATPIQVSVSTNDFIIKTEIKALLNALEVIGINGDLTNFDGTIGLNTLFASVNPGTYDSNQDTMLASAIMHSTITKQISNLTPSGNLIVPTTDVNDVGIEATVSTNYFITKLEIKSLINAMDVLGIGDISSFNGVINLGNLTTDTNQNILLSSAIMHATLSNKLLTGTGGNLLIPDININNATVIRIAKGGVTFIEKTETKALLNALDEMGLTSISGISITPAVLFAADFDIMLGSASMQATISNNILSGALDDTAAAGSGKLVVPNYFREAITISSVADEWIEKVELKALLNSLNTLGITDFSGSVGGGTISSMNDTQLDTMLGSGSMQVTIDNMLKGNSNISSKIPDLAKENVYGMTNITTKIEIKAFIKATQQLGSGDITNVVISSAVLGSMNAAERDIFLDSMIVRNILTDEFEAMMLADDPLITYWPANSDYMNSDPGTFLTKSGIQGVLTFYGI